MTAVAQWIAIGIIAAVGFLLCCVSPFMLFLGAWGGSDSGSVAQGIAWVFALPWAIYLASAIAAGFLIHRRRVFSALAVAACQLVPVIWVGRNFVH